MISLKIGGIIVAAFIAGAFAASPELRAYAADTIGSSDNIDESILSQDIKNGEVKGADIGAGAVTNSKLGTSSVSNSKLQSNSVTTSKIADGGILTADIGNGNVTNAKLAANAVDSTKIVDGSITAADLAPNSVGSSEVSVLTQSDLGSGSVGTAQIIDGTIRRADVGFIKIVSLRDDAAGNALGWNPTGSETAFRIAEPSVQPGPSAILINIDQTADTVVCGVYDYNVGIDSPTGFDMKCAEGAPDRVQY